MAPVRLYVCDSCMRIVPAGEVGEWADFEHVVCKACVRKWKPGLEPGKTSEEGKRK